MKKYTILLVVVLLGFQARAQEIIYGTVRTDGYNKVTKKAFWKTRPEAEKIFFGETPPGYTVYVLEQDYFVRFIDGENNPFDRNYIVFPKGAIVYTDSSGQFYSAICGNKIEYIRPVSMVEVRPEKPTSIIKEEDEWSYSPTTRSPSLLEENNYQEPTTIDIPAITTKRVFDWNKALKIGAISIPVAAILTVGTIYLLKNKSSSGGSIFNPQDAQPVGGK